MVGDQSEETKGRLDVKGREEQKTTDFPSLGKICWKSYSGITEYGKRSMPRWEGKLMSTSRVSCNAAA